MKLAPTALALQLTAAALVGCASLIGADFDHPPASDGSSSADGGTSGDGAASAWCSPPVVSCSSAQPYSGTVSFGVQMSGDAATPYAGAFFASGPRAFDNGGKCTSPVIGGCCITGGTLTFQPGVSAGSIAIRSGSQTLGTLDAKPMADAGDVYTSITLPPWNVGDVLSVQASGDVVAPFTGSITVPPPFTGLSPAFDKTPMVTLPTSVPLVVSWAPGPPGGYVSFSLSGLSCVANDDAGSLTVATELLAATATAMRGGDAYAYMTRAAVTKVASSNADVYIYAIGDNVRGLAKF